MNKVSLEVTYRHGRAIAAYLYLPRRTEDKAEHSRRVGSLVADLTQDGRLIGVEFTSARNVDVNALDQLLAEYKVPSVAHSDLAPLLAA